MVYGLRSRGAKPTVTTTQAGPRKKSQAKVERINSVPAPTAAHAREKLEKLPRREIQALAKANGVVANLKTQVIIDLLLKKQNETAVPTTPSASGPITVQPLDGPAGHLQTPSPKTPVNETTARSLRIKDASSILRPALTAPTKPKRTSKTIQNVDPRSPTPLPGRSVRKAPVRNDGQVAIWPSTSDGVVHIGEVPPSKKRRISRPLVVPSAPVTPPHQVGSTSFWHDRSPPRDRNAGKRKNDLLTIPRGGPSAVANLPAASQVSSPRSGNEAEDEKDEGEDQEGEAQDEEQDAQGKPQYDWEQLPPSDDALSTPTSSPPAYISPRLLKVGPSNKDIRIIRRELTTIVNEQAELEEALGMEELLPEAIEADIKAAQKMVAQITASMSALEEHVAPNMKGDRTVWDGTGFMESKKAEFYWRDWVKSLQEEDEEEGDDGNQAASVRNKEDDTRERSLETIDDDVPTRFSFRHKRRRQEEPEDAEAAPPQHDSGEDGLGDDFYV